MAFAVDLDLSDDEVVVTPPGPSPVFSNGAFDRPAVDAFAPAASKTTQLQGSGLLANASGPDSADAPTPDMRLAGGRDHGQAANSKPVDVKPSATAPAAAPVAVKADATATAAATAAATASLTLTA